MAAAFGGVTTVIEMPNTDPPTDSVEHFLAKKDVAKRNSYVDFGLYGLISDRSYNNIEAMHRAGVVGFKSYLSNSASSHISMIGDGTLLEAFEILAGLGTRCVVHAENGSVIDNRTRRLMAAGRDDGRAHADSRPDVAALEAVSRCLIFSEWTGAPIHIAHEGVADVIDLISAAKHRGVNVTVETCPQYLLLSVDDLSRIGGLMRCNPPLRDPSNHERLWRALKSGEIDVIATDHAPHTPKEKLKRDIWECQCGMLGVETAMSLMLTEVSRGRLTLSEYVRLSARPTPPSCGGFIRARARCKSAPMPTSLSSIWKARPPSTRSGCTPKARFRPGMAARCAGSRSAPSFEARSSCATASCLASLAGVSMSRRRRPRLRRATFSTPLPPTHR